MNSCEQKRDKKKINFLQRDTQDYDQNDDSHYQADYYQELFLWTENKTKEMNCWFNDATHSSETEIIGEGHTQATLMMQKKTHTSRGR